MKAYLNFSDNLHNLPSVDGATVNNVLFTLRPLLYSTCTTSIHKEPHIQNDTVREKGHCIATDDHDKTTIGTEDINKIYIEVMTKQVMYKSMGH